MKMSKPETIVFTYTRNKEHIQAIRDMAKAYGGSLDEWLHFVIISYMHKYGMPRRVDIPTKLFQILAKQGREEKRSVDEVATEILSKAMIQEKG